MIAYRMQDESRDLAELLDPEQQYSYPMNTALTERAEALGL